MNLSFQSHVIQIHVLYIKYTKGQTVLTRYILEFMQFSFVHKYEISSKMTQQFRVSIMFIQSNKPQLSNRIRPLKLDLRNVITPAELFLGSFNFFLEVSQENWAFRSRSKLNKHELI